MKWPSFFNRKKKEKEGSNLVKIVNEKVGIKESRTAILEGVRVHLRWLLATILVMIGVPLGFFFGAKPMSFPPSLVLLLGSLLFILDIEH